MVNDDLYGFATFPRLVAEPLGLLQRHQRVGVAMHEILEMAAKISPDEVDGLRFKGEKPQPASVTFVQPPPPTPVQTPQDVSFNKYWEEVGIPYAKEQFQTYKDYGIPQQKAEYDLFKNVTEPYFTDLFANYQNYGIPQEKAQYDLFKDVTDPQQRSNFALFQDVFEPSTRAMGGRLAADLTEPLQLPQDQWDKIWQTSKDRAVSAYEPISRQASQRFAGAGSLESSGAVQNYFKDLDLSKAKNIEDLAVNQALQEWGQKINAKQQATENSFRFLGYQPAGSNASGPAAPNVNPYGMFSLPAQNIPYGNSTWNPAQAVINPAKQGQLNVGQTFGSYMSPLYGDIMRGQGYNVGAPSTKDYMQLGGQMAGGF